MAECPAKEKPLLLHFAAKKQESVCVCGMATDFTFQHNTAETNLALLRAQKRGALNFFSHIIWYMTTGKNATKSSSKRNYLFVHLGVSCFFFKTSSVRLNVIITYACYFDTDSSGKFMPGIHHTSAI